MFDIKAALVTFLNTYKGNFGTSTTISADNDDEADQRVISGRAPLTSQAIFVVGDCNEEHTRFSLAFNRVKTSVHMNHYYRHPAASGTLTGIALSDVLQSALIVDKLGSSYAIVPKIYVEPKVKIHENIYRTRFILEAVAYEAVNTVIAQV